MAEIVGVSLQVALKTRNVDAVEQATIIQASIAGPNTIADIKSTH